MKGPPLVGGVSLFPGALVGVTGKGLFLCLYSRNVRSGIFTLGSGFFGLRYVFIHALKRHTAFSEGFQLCRRAFTFHIGIPSKTERI